MNIGFKEAGKLYDNQCYIFHDVDLLPEDDRNLYSCPNQPRHMSAAVDTMSYRYVQRIRIRLHSAKTNEPSHRTALPDSTMT